MQSVTASHWHGGRGPMACDASEGISTSGVPHRTSCPASQGTLWLDCCSTANREFRPLWSFLVDTCHFCHPEAGNSLSPFGCVFCQLPESWYIVLVSWRSCSYRVWRAFKTTPTLFCVLDKELANDCIIYSLVLHSECSASCNLGNKWEEGNSVLNPQFTAFRSLGLLCCKALSWASPSHLLHCFSVSLSLYLPRMDQPTHFVGSTNISIHSVNVFSLAKT